ncbi:hypothetical protein Hbl1158_04380 [Halobaculum sp. CBA1158]|uniref:hypothetical protein n=1 Tax=Halobaculum sp. CBA1158 TaxID=2904243 RepID=UPI001F320799|nr:hypothetical protein [Halobaculum sp. CBA1158]UIP00604.1 hypothetical protein Hbl1158_04380 [Halobaculum sp. CBA1158]
MTDGLVGPTPFTFRQAWVDVVSVDIPEEMATITERHAGEKLRFFAVVDPDDREVDPVRLRSDLEWTENREQLVQGELMEVVAKESYEQEMNATNVNQIIKVADDKVLFTGFVADDVVVAAFDRGIFGSLPPIVSEFAEFMRAHDIDFVSLEM